LIDNDGQYPKKDKDNWYFIAGGNDDYFKATALEFYGVKK